MPTTETVQPSSLYTVMGGKLGIPKISSDEDLASLVEKRLPVRTVKALVRGGFSEAEIYQLVVPRRTLSHRIAKHEPLSSEESDRAVRVARVTAHAERVFGDPEKAWRWLRKPKTRFDGKSPLEMLTTEAGARLVDQMIVQIDHGMF
ncbi:MAG TPA: antitoxin Xre/MbcA/ParS toxin-binding domain-containing protein [Bryobacteraceae bacterium]|nr:antitoxin Xre/MbcA/ParS toxin-binding domain-containing protein [Bryobacteraceae bacterium]